MKIGIFGGSFNPVHKMHKKIGKTLLEQGIIDKVIYVPTGNYYDKKELIDAEHRYKMLKLMIQNNKKFEVSDYELKNTLTYTYQTLMYFQNQYPEDEIYFICGTDNLKEFKTWKNYQFILDHFKIIVIKRNHDDLQSILKEFSDKDIIVINDIVDSISSTQIRKKIHMNQDHNLLEYLSFPVLEYIEKEKLYKEEI